jgi:uncharacterized damage-inducible protein DinB
MTVGQMLLVDFDYEAQSTRRVLERVPADKLSWKPHEKSMSLGSLAGHVASLAYFGLVILTTPQLNMAVDSFPKFEFTTPEAAVEHAEVAVAKIRAILADVPDETMLEHWRLLYGETLILDAPRVQAYRVSFFNHLIHHRGQLNVYLRLLDVKVPGIYGPSADEPFGS